MSGNSWEWYAHLENKRDMSHYDNRGGVVLLEEKGCVTSVTPHSRTLRSASIVLPGTSVQNTFSQNTLSRHRSYVFTYNNPSEGWRPEVVWEADQSPRHGFIRFLAGQFEMSDSGTRHFQGYVVFNNPQGLPGCRRHLNVPTGHFEPRKGTHQQALDYCHKDETRCAGEIPFALGDPPAQGERSDLDGVKDIIDAGGTELEVSENAFGAYIRYHAGIRRAISLRGSHRRDAPRAYYFWGPSGTGKSYSAHHYFGYEPAATYPVPLSSGTSIWFDGYDPRQHKVVIMDDYYHNFKFSFLLQLLDEYPVYIPYKGGHCPFSSPIIIITSNIGLHEQYPKIPDQVALWRRFKRVVLFTDNMCSICTGSNVLGIQPAIL